MIPHLITERFPYLALPYGDGGPCIKAQDWLRDLPAGTTVKQALALCPHAEWLVWLCAFDLSDMVAAHALRDLARSEAQLAAKAGDMLRHREILANIEAAEANYCASEPFTAEFASALYHDAGVLERVRLALWSDDA